MMTALSQPQQKSCGVCVVIAAHNAAETLARAVRSALAQRHVREVIVVDDASQDATHAQAHAADDGTGRLRILRLERNAGPAAARNFALAHSVSPYFCVLDADDFMLPGRLERLLGHHADKWDMIADDIAIVPEDAANLTLPPMTVCDVGDVTRIDLARFIAGNLARNGRRRSELGFLKPVFSRAFLKRHGIAYREDLRLGEDYALYVEALLAGAVFQLAGPCGYVAVELAGSLSSRHRTEDLRQLLAFDDEVLRDGRLNLAERAALLCHRRQIRCRLIHREVLDEARTKGRAAALCRLSQTPTAIPHVLSQTLRDKTRIIASRFGGAASPRSPAPRLLIGAMPLLPGCETTVPADEPIERIECVGAAGCASPEVSFIVAAYNVAPYIEAAIRSALGQVDACVEVVVVDDGSEDATADIVAELAKGDSRVRLIRRAANAGPSAARNEAIAAARGSWVAILDGDDLVAPERTRRLLDLAAVTSADIVADNFERFVAVGAPKGQRMIRHRDAPFVLQVDVPAFLRGNCALSRPGFSLGAVKCMFRADFLRAHTLRHPENLDFGEDYHFVLSCLMAGACFFVTSDALYAYRLRASSVSWRMTARHIGRLLAEHRALRLEERYGGEPDVLAAATEYAQSLERAMDFVRVVDLAKQARWREALAKAATRPAAWPLLVRFGGHALLKRIGLMQA